MLVWGEGCAVRGVLRGPQSANHTPRTPHRIPLIAAIPHTKYLRPLIGVAIAILVGCSDPVTPRSGVPTLDDAVGGEFISVSAGREHTCALVTDGTAYCWGSNEFGQLGVPADATTCLREDRPIPCKREPVAVSGGLAFQKIRAGGTHTCGLTQSGLVYCWGDNIRGAVGDPAVRITSSPVPVISGDSFIDLAAGGSHTCGLRTDGAAFCWGWNESGQIGVGAVGTGAAVPTAVQSAQRFSSIVAGERRTCARTADGSTFCWGATWVTRQGATEITRVQGQPARVLPSPAFRVLAVGSNNTCGVGVDRRAYCWEANPTGALGDGSTTGSPSPIGVVGNLEFVAISVGALQTCAIAVTGLAYCWGAASSGQLGVSPAALNARCGAENATTMVCSRVPVRVSGWRVFTEIAAGQGDHVCGVTLGGSIYCWGAGRMGQRGDGRSTNEWSPARTR